MSWWHRGDSIACGSGSVIDIASHVRRYILYTGSTVLYYQKWLLWQPATRFFLRGALLAPSTVGSVRRPLCYMTQYYGSFGEAL